MKKSKIFLACWAWMMALTLTSCGDINDKHQVWIDTERVYIGKPDSVTAYPGKGRIKLTWYQNSDPDIEETVIYWNAKDTSIVKPFVRELPGLQKDSVMIDNLKEGTYYFELVNKNSNGNKQSIISSVQGVSYGNKYISELRLPAIDTIRVVAFDKQKQSATIRLRLGIQAANNVGTILRYKKFSTGENVEITLGTITPVNRIVILQDVGNRLQNPEDMISMVSLYRPVRAIDTFESAELKQQVLTYTVTSGQQTKYNSAGDIDATLEYGRDALSPTVVDKHFRLVANPENTFWCDRLGNLASTTDYILFQYFLTLKSDNVFDVSGASYNRGTPPVLVYTIVNTEKKSTYDPVTRKIKIYNKQIPVTGSPTLFEEELIPKELE